MESEDFFMPAIGVPRNLQFLMTDVRAHMPMVCAKISVATSTGGMPFTPSHRHVEELGHGLYFIDTTEAERAAESIGFRFDAPGCDSLVMFFQNK